MPDLTVSGLSKAFGNTVVLDEISFGVGEGELCILLGPSGCGKTTLLRIIAGLETQDAGEIRVEGEDVGDLTPRERDVAMVFQSYALYPHMTAFDNMAFPLRARKLPGDEIDGRVRRTARLLGIEKLLDRKPSGLSGGQRQRVAIGRAIVRSPRLFLFDEPLSNLDASLRTEMRVEIANLHRELAATMVYVTHDQVEAMTLGDKIVLLHDGVVQQIGSPDDLYRRPANLFVAGFIGSPRMNLVEGRLEAGEDGVVFRAPDVGMTCAVPPWADEHEGHEVVLGVRPEALSLTRIEDGAAGGGDAHADDESAAVHADAGDGAGAAPRAGGQGSAGAAAREGARGVGAAATAAVELVEHIGSETLVHLELPDTRITARARAGWHAEPGQRVALSTSADRVHLFDAGSGTSLAP